MPYHNATINMVEKFRNFYIDYVPCQQNIHADALASLAASLVLLVGATEKVLVYSYDLYHQKFAFEKSQAPRGDLQVEEVLETLTGPELRNWRFPFIDFVQYNILPDDPKEVVIGAEPALKICMFCKINEKLVCANVPLILPL